MQVVDGRDPLTYFSTDLADAARELHPTKASLVLLNKSDLLPPAVRVAWARHFRAAGIDCAFWSAYAAAEAQLKAKQVCVLAQRLPPSLLISPPPRNLTALGPQLCICEQGRLGLDGRVLVGQGMYLLVTLRRHVCVASCPTPSLHAAARRRRPCTAWPSLPAPAAQPRVRRPPPPAPMMMMTPAGWQLPRGCSQWTSCWI